jgi:hypothetical protein
MEIYKIPAEKSFKGIATFKMAVVIPSLGSNMPLYSSPYLSNSDSVFGKDGPVIIEHDLENVDAVRVFARDPGVQQKILDAAASSMRSAWSNKALTKTWSETKDLFFTTYKERLNSFLDALRFDLYVIYKVKLNENAIADPDPAEYKYDPYPTFVYTQPTAVKSFLFHELIDDSALGEVKEIFARGLEVLVEKEMRPFMEDEITRRDNDIQLLKILTSRYPNFEELIKKQEA